jgi:hypothetical protein
VNGYGAGRPTVDDVARVLRARTKDQFGNEVGTFDDDTRPRGAQVDEQIDASFAAVRIRLPTVIADELLPAVAGCVALHAACAVEKAYRPEEVVSGRSPYEQLLAEFVVEMQALIEATEAGVGGPTAKGITSIAVGSWTLIT